MLSYSIYRNKKSIKWVTFIHGAGGSSAIWFKQVRVFSKFFNVLLIDLRGHGNSKSFIKSYRDYTFDGICIDIIEVLDFEKIKKSNFVGISLGTILIRNIAKINPDRVVSMILGGAILDLNFKSKLLMKIANWTKKILPYMFIYKVLSFVVMPNNNQKESRNIFIREAKKLYQKEFIRWFKLTIEIIPLLRIFRNVQSKIPTLYLMGSEDYLFLPAVKKVAQDHIFSRLKVIPNCGHVVNIEKPKQFNEITINFIDKLN
ncbi:MAG: alpha/beta hydrolase [Bacteroidota bacterium]|mgnify:FL=1|nr:alpha/beta hydrolase [Bacteroidota bacterium]|tara:strand:+ start:118 stop:894 length:777 start_codon:yes stop_codon:yes gene_type:complete